MSTSSRRRTLRRLAELSAERLRRDADPNASHPPLFVIIDGVSKFRDLRKSDDDFSLSGFGSSSDDAPADPGQQFTDLLSKGPDLGMHVLLWADTYSNADRWLSRQSMREFELRIAFTMNAADSSNFLDSPLASRLGVHRGLLYREETGTLTKFRPYGPPHPNGSTTFAHNCKPNRNWNPRQTWTAFECHRSFSRQSCR
ncbi:MAG: hypothetical protein R3B91_16790 [Planctomycetaceae bacterium]